MPKLLAAALVSSHLDYCNSLLHGIADADLVSLQCIQNQLAYVTSFYSQCSTASVPSLVTSKFRVLFKINLRTDQMLHEKQPVYLYFMLAASLPFRSWRANEGIRLSVPSVKVHRRKSFLLSCHVCLEQPPAVCPSAFSVAILKCRDISRRISLTWPLPHVHGRTRWRFDVIELLHRFCCRTPIWVSRHWAWLCRGYWRYRNLIDWWNICSTMTFEPKASSSRYDSLHDAPCRYNVNVYHAASKQNI